MHHSLFTDLQNGSSVAHHFLLHSDDIYPIILPLFIHAVIHTPQEENVLTLQFY